MTQMYKVNMSPRWPERVANAINRYGSLRVSAMFFILALIIAVAESTLVQFFLEGEVSSRSLLSPVILTLITAPWILYFITELIRRLDRSRDELTQVIFQLEELRAQDRLTTESLKQNIKQLNHEIEERKRAELQREEAISLLQQEIEERARTQQSLYDQSVLLRSCFDCSPDIIYYRDENGRFSGCNQSLEKLTGKSENEMIGLTPWDVYPEEVAEQVVASDKEVLSTNASLSYDIWLTYPDGSKRAYEFKKVPFFNKQGKRIGLLGFGRDIMERKKAQLALEKASRDKTSFISTISHELRTPLNGIVGISRMLKETPLPSESKQQISTIHACAITLGNIFNDIIDLDRMERDRLEINLESVQLDELVNEMGTVAKLLAEQKGLSFDFSSQVDSNTWVSADPTRIRQVLWNLLANAVKFTLEGEVRFIVECHTSNDALWLDFEISDTGIGIDQQELDNIFTMYYQVDREEVRAGTGTGIGLAISKRLMEAMGGQIEVFSEINDGSSFNVSIRLDLIEAPEENSDANVIKPLHILLVEDVELNIVVAQSLLEKMGHSLEIARTGKEALALFKPNHFDLLLLDIQLPDMTGFDITDNLQKQYNTLPPMVALTANVAKTKAEYKALGLDDVIGKPIKPNVVTEVFSRLFNNETIPYQQAVEQNTTTADHVPLACCPSDSELVVVDCDFVETMMQTIGFDMVEQNLALFEKLIAEYLVILDSNLQAKDQEAISKEAHKIKGAAASIGLCNIQKVAYQIETFDSPAWWQNLEERIERLKYSCEADVKTLKDWLYSQ